MDEDMIIDVEFHLLHPHVATDHLRRVLRQLRVQLHALLVPCIDQSVVEDVAHVVDLWASLVDKHDVDDGTVRLVVL